jgi:protein-S-isoprenylcysteine O-methyltransferase Ste14
MHVITFFIAFLWIVLLFFWLVSSLRAKQSFRNFNWGLQVVVRIAIAVVVILFLRIPSFHQWISNNHANALYSNFYISLAGFFVFLLGFLLAMWARISIGRNWGMPMTIKDKPVLVTSGPYAYIRHPIYSGMLFAMLGSCLSVNIYWVVPLIVMLLYFIYSLKVEERNMGQLFPKEYEEYKKNTKALIPYIY